MKQSKLLAIGVLVLAFVVFFLNRPVRERSCPLSKNSALALARIKALCDEQGGVMVDGQCTCLA